MIDMMGKIASVISYGAFLFLTVLLVAFTQYEWMWVE